MSDNEPRPAEPQFRAALAEIKNELKLLAISYILFSIAVFIAFKNSSVSEILRTTAGIYWMFVLPGYALSLCSKQGFVERLIIGLSVQAGVFGLASYYAGLLGWHVATHAIVLPLISIIVGIVLWRRK